ncbi:ribitol-5-phosphate dehydrogenase [Anaerovorax odorimutans]|uniref:Ribulose-5-phosphate reductase n=1 Tax=Anaerovorax odorimutans TaxID=109327 RepID=A0ABT1RJA0_9FIRM|nr:ribitol-5-phosphate dehydrogenase [Anaerovorax odorimutans]MCQ4635267.1 ribitol-5-phosphate dehydrogenase [Anaerovorax odorimutans]
MLNAVYRLVEPRRFEIEFTDIDLFGDQVIVRPTHLSICNADQRYYQGKRAPEVLAKKLPMALIHEGIGRVVYDPKGEFKKGQNVVMIPNTPVEEDEIIAENYLRSSKFRASGFDGFMQDNVALNRDRVILLPEGINKEVAAFTEIASVSYHAITRFGRFSHERRAHIGVWGDGNLAFITSVFLRYRYPDANLYIFGVNNDKLSDFTFADATYHVNEIPENVVLDHAFECVGGEGSPKAINQIIDYINPEGTISILGVSENPVPINTRMILEKGLRVFGSSRSGRKDFEDTIRLYEENPQVVQYLENLVGDVVEIKEIKDFTKAFEADIHKAGGKTIMVWNK